MSEKRITGDSSSHPTAETFDVFISHSSADKDVARVLAQGLTDRGLRVWFDEYVIQPGQKWSVAIKEGIERSRLCIILLSRDAQPQNPWLSTEWSAIQECSWRRRDLSLCSIKLDEVATPPFLRPWQSINCDSRLADASDLESTLRKIVVYVLDRDALRRTSLFAGQGSETTERFEEICRSLPPERNQQGPEEGSGGDE